MPQYIVKLIDRTKRLHPLANCDRQFVSYQPCADSAERAAQRDHPGLAVLDIARKVERTEDARTLKWY